MGNWNFSGQVVVITGGGGGFGKSLTKRFSDSGATVYICGRSESVKELSNMGGNSIRVEMVDVTSIEQVGDWVERIVRESGRIDILINAAGYCPVSSIEEMSGELWDRIIDVNLKGTFLLSQAVMTHMERQRYGRIVNISSIAAFTGGSIVSAAYSAAKGGVVSLTKSFAVRLSPHGITVNCIAPGPIETSMIADFPEETMRKLIANTPTRQVGSTDDITNAVMFLADKSSSHLTGITLDVNGGLYMR